MNFSPKVSIIIPVYNGSNYLREAIESSLAQTYKNIEIIVVNDGSNDHHKTRKIAVSYDDKIRYYEKENGGVATALNFGISEMKGEYFSWLSHDDLYYENKIEVQIDHLNKQKNKDIISYSDFSFVDGKGNKIGIATLDHEMLTIKPFYGVLRGAIHGCTLLIPKKYFHIYGMFDPSLKTTQDYDLWFKMIRHVPFVHIPEVLVKSRRHKAQESIVNPASIHESNILWTAFMDIMTDEEKLGCENSIYKFYREMEFFLKTTPYLEAANYAKNKANGELTSLKNNIASIKVSVVIPFYNRIQCTIEAVKSALDQTHKNIEIVVVDDGSTENTNQIISVSEKDNRIKYLKLQRNSGVSVARNAGIQASSGKYIALLDSDDQFLPEKIEKQLLFMEQEGCFFSHTSYYRIDGFGDQKPEIVHSGSFSDPVFPRILGNCSIATPTVMAKRELFLEFPFVDNIHLGEDVINWIKISKKFHIFGIDIPLSKIQVSASSAAIDLDKQIFGINNILSFILTDDDLKSYYEQIGLLYQILFISYLKKAGKIDLKETCSINGEFSAETKKIISFLRTKKIFTFTYSKILIPVISRLYRLYKAGRILFQTR